MSDDCCDDDVPAGAPVVTEEQTKKWWSDPSLLVPLASGVALVSGFSLNWAGFGTIALIVYWVGLLLGAYTFVPGAVRNLVTKRKLGIALLMTISAVGAVILGFVEEAAALAFLYSISEALEDRAMNRARDSLRALLKLVPETATVLREGVPAEVPARELVVGQILMVRPGERVATDGVVATGYSSLDTSAITGESIPVEVGPGAAVTAGSINSSGSLEVKVTADGTDNSLTTIVSLVEQAQARKGERARLADRIARPLVPGVILLAVAVGIIGVLLSGDPQTWITRALVVLVAASPCALAISVPVTVVSAIGAASKLGVIIKSGAAFEQLSTIRHVAFDKTGTLTRNSPTVTAIVTHGGASEAEAFQLASALEQHSTHPLGTAITAASSQIPAASEVFEEPGRGITGRVGGQTVTVGSPRWVSPGPLAREVEAMEAAGQTCVIVARDSEVIGAIGVRDELRSEVPEAIQTLRQRGITVSMLTGDNKRTANAIATIADIRDVHAELRPEDKALLITGFARRSPTAMIGDGINDAPALAGATVGIAMGVSGSDAAIESADIAFTGHDLRLIPMALLHAHRGRTIINQNIALSLLVILTLLPLAITGVLGLAAVVLVHEVAEVLVIANGLRAARMPRTRLNSPREVERLTAPAGTHSTGGNDTQFVGENH